MSEVPAALTSFQSIVDLWSTRDEMASDIGASVPMVTKWRQRNRIPDEWWSAILGTERAAAAGLTADIFVSLAAVSARPADDALAEATA